MAESFTIIWTVSRKSQAAQVWSSEGKITTNSKKAAWFIYHSLVLESGHLACYILIKRNGMMLEHHVSDGTAPQKIFSE